MPCLSQERLAAFEITAIEHIQRDELAHALNSRSHRCANLYIHDWQRSSLICMGEKEVRLL
jgi:hypothetical protein